MKLQIYKYLDCSTCHISREDAERLDSARPGLPAVCGYEFGWFVSIGALEPERLEEYSSEFRTILREAKKSHCLFVRFDADGMLYRKWRAFDW